MHWGRFARIAPRLGTSLLGLGVGLAVTACSPLTTSASAPTASTLTAAPVAGSTPAAGAAAGKTPTTAATAPVPAGFVPASVTFVSPSLGWVVGQAGTPGSCQNSNPDICTAIAQTDNAGETWDGDPAPDTGVPNNATGVSDIRFLDGVNGWAFGPELWVTHDAGQSWQQENTDGARVTDLEAADGRAYALFATCNAAGNTEPAGDWAYGCTSFTLMTTTADGDEWTPVSETTSVLANPQPTNTGYIGLYGTTGFLVGPDGTLYSGPIGGTWTKVGTMPCQPGANYANGQAAPQIATISSTQLATYCGGHTPTAQPTIYTSDDGGATWTVSSAGWARDSYEGAADSITATSDGTIVLGTIQGITILPAGATTWQAATINGSLAANVDGLVENGGFSYVDMTSPTQGVAISGAPAVHEIWLTSDGGQTWTPSAITQPAGSAS